MQFPASCVCNIQIVYKEHSEFKHLCSFFHHASTYNFTFFQNAYNLIMKYFIFIKALKICIGVSAGHLLHISPNNFTLIAPKLAEYQNKKLPGGQR